MAREALGKAQNIAVATGSVRFDGKIGKIGTQHLLLAIMEVGGEAASILTELGIEREAVLGLIAKKEHKHV